MNLKDSFRALLLLLVTDSKWAVDGVKAPSRKDRRQRALKSSKSLKSSKAKGQGICLGLEGTVIQIKGVKEDEPVIGQLVSKPECFNSLECALTTTPGVYTSDLNERQCDHYTNPFIVNRDTGADSIFAYKTDQKTIGKGALFGEVTAAASSDTKFILEYWDQDIINQPAETLDLISYDYFQNTCPSSATSCAGQFYLNLYLRKPELSTNFYDCRLNFVPTEGMTGEWTTLEVTPDTTANTARNRPSTLTDTCAAGMLNAANGCPCTLAQAAVEDYVFATGGECNGFTLAFNMGDTSGNDSGLSGYYDRIIIKYKDEDAARVYDFDPK